MSVRKQGILQGCKAIRTYATDNLNSDDSLQEFKVASYGYLTSEQHTLVWQIDGVRSLVK